MRNSSINLILISMHLSVSPVINAQEYIDPQWKFHLAFEDATGARDTVWIMLDSQIPVGNFGLNEEFGEVPYILDSTVFNVFTYLNLTEVSKVRAFNLELPFDFPIYASNYVYPLTLSWDTTLFFSSVLAQTEAGLIMHPTLDNDYFFNYHAEVGKYHMIYESQVEMPWFGWLSQDHFPLYVAFDRGFWSWEPPISTRNVHAEMQLQLYPNPAIDMVHIDQGQNASTLYAIDIFAMDGRHLLSATALADIDGVYHVDVSSLPPGMYVIHGISHDGSKRSGRFVK